MAKDIDGKLDKVEIQGPYENKKGGTYFKHVYTIGDETYFQFANEGDEPKAKIGDNVRMLVESTQFGNKISNKIVALNKSSGNTSTTPQLFKSENKEVKEYKSKKWAPPSKQSTGYNPDGARTGMIVKAAVDLAISDATYLDKQIDEDDLNRALKLVQDLTNKAEGK